LAAPPLVGLRPVSSGKIRQGKALPHTRGQRPHEGQSRKSRQSVAEDLFDLVGWDHFELGVGAISRLLVRSPTPELGRVAKTIALHVLVRHFNH